MWVEAARRPRPGCLAFERGLRVRFGYRPGDEIPALTDGLAVAKLS